MASRTDILINKWNELTEEEKQELITMVAKRQFSQKAEEEVSENILQDAE